MLKAQSAINFRITPGEHEGQFIAACKSIGLTIQYKGESEDGKQSYTIRAKAPLDFVRLGARCPFIAN